MDAGARALDISVTLGATRLYIFNGFESIIRQSVDPAWPNVTPTSFFSGAMGRSSAASARLRTDAEKVAALEHWRPNGASSAKRREQ
jgi:hypothetical protein